MALQSPPAGTAAKVESNLASFKKQCNELCVRLADAHTDASKELTAFLELVAQHEQHSLPEDQTRHFSVEVLNKAVKAIMGKTYVSDSNVIELVNSTLQRVLDIVIAHLNDDSYANALLLETITNDTLGFYRHYGLEKLDSSKAQLEDSEELQAFRKTIEFMKWIDVYSSQGKWRAAQVTDVNEKQFKIMFEQQPEHTAEWIDKDSTRLAPLHSRSRGNIEPWRLELKVGSKVDVLDTVNKWYTGSVLEVKGDNLLCNYDEWSNKFDEFIPRTSERLAPHKTRATGGKSSGGVQHISMERTIDDSNDPEDVVAVFRGKEWSSFLFVENVKYFAAKGGYEKLLARIQRHQPNVPVPILRIYVECIARAANVFTKSFAKQFIPSIRDAAFETVLNLNDNELRDLSKEHLEEITKSMNLLLRRVDTYDNVRNQLDLFNLSSALRRFQCPIVERRVNGMTYLAEAVTKVRHYQNIRQGTINSKWMLQWLKDNQILETCFGKNSHPELMRRSADILKFIASENKLQQEHMDLIWDAIKSAMRRNEESTLVILFKVIDDIAWQFDAFHVEYLFSRMAEIPFEEYISSTLDLLKELSRLTYRAGPAAAEKATALLWSIIQDDSKASTEIQNHARLKLEDVLADYTQKANRIPYIHKCVENVRNHTSVPQSLDVLRKILETYPTQPNAVDEHTRWAVIGWMQEQLQWMDHFFADLDNWKTQVRQFIEEKNVSADAVSELIVTSRQPYMPQLRKRLQFLQYMLSNSALKLNQQQVDTLWDDFYTKALCTDEREFCLYWLKTAVDPKGHTLFDNDVSEHLFNSKMTQGLDVVDLSNAGYECLERYFILLNTLKGNLEFKNESGSSSDVAANENYCVRSFDLIGFDVIWRVALETQRPQVVKKSIAFLNSLHEKLSGELKATIASIRSDYIKKCMKHFKEYVDNKDFSRIERCLSLLNHLLDASETKGIGRLRSHGAQLRGAPLQLNVQNNIPKSDKAKKLTIIAHANDTLWELREACGKELGMSADSVRIITGGSELKAEQNPKKLSELKLTDSSTIIITKKIATTQQRVPLLQNKEVVPALRRALTEIFNKFATGPDGTMSKENMATYILACGAGEGSASPKRISTIFTKYGDDENGILPMAGFFEFYRDACEDRVEAVWTDLSVHGYRADLRHEREVAAEEAKNSENEKSMPRYLLSSNNDYFNLLFHSLNLEDAIASQVWSLVQRLPTNPTLKHNLVSLELVSHPEPDWNALLDSRSAYKLLYSLQIIESLTEPRHEEDKKEDENKVQSEDDSVDPLAWRRKFLLSGGFKHLYTILIDHKDFSAGDVSAAMTDLKKNCLELLLKMLRTFILGAISVNAPMLDIIERVRLEAAADETLPAKMETKEKTTTTGGSVSFKEDNIPEAPELDDEFDPFEYTYNSYERESKEKEKKEQEPEPDAEELKRRKAEEEKIRERGREGAFRALVRQMSVGFADKLLEFIDFPLLNQSLMDLIHLSATKATSEADAKVVHYAANLWVSIVLYQPDVLLPEIYKRFVPAKGDSPLFSIIQASNPKIRKDFATSVYQICAFSRAEPGPHMVFFDLLTRNIPSFKDNPIDCAEQFWLHSELLKDAMGGKSGQRPSNFEPLLKEVVRLLREHVTSELSELGTSDQVLIGLLTLCMTLVNEPAFRAYAGARNHGDLVHEVFQRFLFQEGLDEINPNDGPRKVKRSLDPTMPKCKTKASRHCAFRLLAALCNDNQQNLDELLLLLAAQQKTITQLSVYDYNPEKHMMAPCGYVGLRNLGSTCYMNSLLQQFYMIPQFRYGMLMAEDKEEDKANSVLYQLQTLFGFLAFSEKQAYDTTPFCHSYKDENGRPVDVRVQQDAQEFFNVLVDRLEHRLKGSPQAKLIRQLFGGHMMNQLICHGGCETVRESSEDFNTISLEVKGRTDLADSLTAYVGGELLSDFNCPTCLKKCEITRRSVLGSMANTIIFHLKRFDLNWETFQHEKVNSRFGFPMEINLEPYTKEGRARLDAEAKLAAKQAEAKASADGKAGDDDGKGDDGKGDSDAPIEVDTADAKTEKPSGADAPKPQFSEHPKEYYQYELVGIIIHTGTAQAGHYYSFIRERTGEKRWLEFNDNNVRPFDIRRLEEECFGGEQQQMENNGYGHEYMRTSERVKSAYMLIYDRVQPIPLSQPGSPAPAESKSIGSLPSSNSTGELSLDKIKALVAENESTNPEDTFSFIERCVLEGRLKELVPANIIKGVKEDNDQFMNDRQIFNVDYFNFMNDVIKNAFPPEVNDLKEDGANRGLDVIKLATYFALETLARAGENHLFPEFTEHLKRLFRSNVPACKWFLNDLARKPSTLVELLLSVRDNVVRKAFVGLCVQALTTLSAHEQEFFFEEEKLELPKKALSQDGDQQFRMVPKSAAVNFIHQVIALNTECVKNWTRFSDYFQLLFEFASLTAEHRKVLIQRKLVPVLGDIFLGEQSPFLEKNQKREKMGNRLAQPDFKYLLKTMSVLVRSMTTEATAAHGNPPTQMPGEPIPFSDTDKKIIACKDLYISSMAYGHCPEAIGEIVAHWSFENSNHSDAIVALLLSGIEKSANDNIKPYFDVMKPFLAVNDSLQRTRIEKLLAPHKGLLALLHSVRTHPKITYLAVKLLLSIIEENEAFAQVMMANRGEWQWLDQWLKSYIGKKAVGYGNPPPLARQESREQTFTKYQAQVEKYGGTLSLVDDAAARVAGGPDVGGYAGGDYDGENPPDYEQVSDDEDEELEEGAPFLEQLGAAYGIDAPLKPSAAMKRMPRLNRTEMLRKKGRRLVKGPGGARVRRRNSGDLDAEQGRRGGADVGAKAKRNRSHSDEDEMENLADNFNSMTVGPYSNRRRFNGPSLSFQTANDVDYSADYERTGGSEPDPSMGAVVPVSEVVDNPIGPKLPPGHPRNSGVPPPVVALARWSCNICTYENEGVDHLCIICREGRRDLV